MNPLLKCCGYYCSCILVASLIFFGILIAMISGGNSYLVKDPSQIHDKVKALTTALICNAVIFGLCVSCLVYGRMKEPKAVEEIDLDYDFKQMKHN